MRRLLYIGVAIIVGIVLTTACSTQKNNSRTRFWHSFNARYNTYYNGYLAFLEGTEEKEKGNKDNYTEQLPLYAVSNKQSRELGKGKYDRTIEKMEKAIKQHSIKARPEWKKQRRKTERDKEWLSRKEYNPFLWKAWLMMGQAQFQKGAFDEAAATFAYMSRLYQGQPAISGIARAWLAKCYTELDWLYEAEDVIRNMSRDSIDYRAQREWNATMANYYLKSGELEKAIPYLNETIKKERRKLQKAREWYLMGQIQAALDNKQESFKAYKKVIALNPPYELEFNARIAQTEVMAKGNAKKMIAKLKRMAASDNNKDYLDQVYYAIGNIYLMQNDTAKAIGAYETGNEKATRSGIEKGVLLLTLGNIYWEKEKYNDAQRCYGEAIGLLDKDREDYERLAKRSKILDDLVPHTDAIYLQDSLQALAKMPEEERLEAIDRVIEALKKKEKEERLKAQEDAVAEAQQRINATGNRNQRNTPTPPAATTGRDGKWYFYNQMAVNQGKQQFEKQWGKRENADDWQRANKTVVATLQTETTDSLEATDLADVETTDSLEAEEPAVDDSLANDPHNREYYLAQIPFTEEQVEASNLIIMDGLFNSGVIFKDKLENLNLAEKQLVRLTTDYPNYEQNDQAWYHLFLLYSRRGDRATAQNCLSRLQEDYAESEWTILLSDPYFEENAKFGAHIEDSIYAATYEAFKANEHATVQANAQLTAERFPLGEHRDKFLFINGLSLLNQGDAKGCVEELKTVVEKYPQSEVSAMAGMIIKGVQEGRQLYGGKFDLDDVWTRRDLTLADDSTSTDTLSVDREVPFLFILVYQPDSLGMAATDGRATTGENQLLYDMARFNFSNFLVRNFDLEIERENGVNRMLIRGFLNFDEARQYARKLYESADMTATLQRCRSLIISEHNLSLIGTRYSYQDYDTFYEQYFLPLTISNEELLQIPEPSENGEEPEAEDTIETEETTGSDDDFDDGFDDLDLF